MDVAKCVVLKLADGFVEPEQVVPAPVVGKNLKIVAPGIVEGACARIRDLLEYRRTVDPLALVKMLHGAIGMLKFLEIVPGVSDDPKAAD